MAIGGLRYLSGLDPRMQDAVRYLLAWCDYYSLTADLTSGFRSNEDQAKLYAQGRTAAEIANQVHKRGAGGAVTDAPPGSSAHNYGLAVDVEGRDQQAVIELAREIGFGLVSWDPAHIEWPGWESLLNR